MAQKVEVDSGSVSSSGEVQLTQVILRVPGGTVVTASWEALVENDDGSVTVDAEVQFYDSSDSLIQAFSGGPMAPGTSTRFSVVADAPSDTVYAKLVFFVRWASSDSDGDVTISKPRVTFRDDAAWVANPFHDVYLVRPMGGAPSREPNWKGKRLGNFVVEDADDVAFDGY